MKRVGYFFLCLLPLLASIGLQNLVAIPLFGISAIIVLLREDSAIPLGQLLDECSNLWTSSSLTTWISLIYAIASLFLFVLWYRKKIAQDQEQVPFPHTFNRQIVIGTLLLAAGLQYVTTYLMNFVGVLRPDWMQAYESLMRTAGITSPSILMVLYACILGPISEEFIFRGVTYGYAKKVVPTAAAVCIQAVLFGIFHMNMIQGIYATFIGLFLGYICEAGGTIAHSVLLHIFFNLCGLFVNPHMYYQNGHLFFFLLWLTLGVLMAYAGIFLFQRGVAVRDRNLYSKAY